MAFTFDSILGVNIEKKNNRKSRSPRIAGDTTQQPWKMVNFYFKKLCPIQIGDSELSGLTVWSTHQLSQLTRWKQRLLRLPLQLLHLRELLWHFGFQNRKRAWLRTTAILWKPGDVHSVMLNRYLVINISSSPVSLTGVGWTTTVSGRGAGDGRMIAVAARERVEASKRTSGQSSDSLRALLKQCKRVTIKRDFPKSYWVFPIFLKCFPKRELRRLQLITGIETNVSIALLGYDIL